MSVPTVSVRLSVFDRQVLSFVEAKGRVRQGLCLATSTIATHFGVTVRYVQKSLKKLIELGKISREWDYGLRTRRRFRVGSVSPLVNEQEGVESTNSCTLRSDSPPISALESAKKGTGDDGETPPPQIVQSPGPIEEKTLDPEAIAQVAERVSKATRPDPTFPARLAAIARKWGLAYLLPAVDRLEAKVSTEVVGEPIGYLFNTIRGLVEQGPPPPPKLTKAELYALEEARREAAIETLRRALEESAP